MRLAIARQFPRGDERGREVLERYIDRMSRIIADMTDLVRLEQDALALELSPVDVAVLLRETIDAYMPDAQLRHVKLTLEGGTEAAWVNADMRRLLQVFANVLDNALKFTPPDGAVLVSMTLRPASIEIRVRDTGTGITSELLPRVFDLYAGETTNGGMGIGLTVASCIVRLHHGDIAVHSDGAERGTQVVITLPLIAAHTARSESLNG